MSLKRILDKQLELNDYYDGLNDRPIETFKSQKEKHKTMNFLNELKALNEAYVSPKLEEVKTKLKVQAKSGNKMATLRASEIDTYTAKWLKNEGLTVEDSWSGTREEGESIVIIKW